MKPVTRLLADCSGVAILEFALIMPLLLMMLAGIFEYSRVLLVEHAVRDIIDERVREGVITDMTASDVETAVEAELAEVPGIENYDVDVTDGTELAITVTGSFDLVMGGLLPEDAISFEMTTQFPR